LLLSSKCGMQPSDQFDTLLARHPPFHPGRHFPAACEFATRSSECHGHAQQPFVRKRSPVNTDQRQDGHIEERNERRCNDFLDYDFWGLCGDDYMRRFSGRRNELHDQRNFHADRHGESPRYANDYRQRQQQPTNRLFDRNGCTASDCFAGQFIVRQSGSCDDQRQ